MKLERLKRKLEVEFDDTSLLDVALTHRSADSVNNERLEYLGDAVLDLVVAETLFNLYPSASEGELSRYRSSLVKGETLASVARELELGDYIRMGPGELKSGGYRRASILADALESIIGAIYIDKGLDDARAFVLSIYQDRINNLKTSSEHKDPKTRLQEYLQGHQQELPEYEVVQVSGQPHDQQFVVECRLNALDIMESGEGSSRRRAEQQAANKVLDRVFKGA